MLGDSVTYGAIVGQADTYTAVLERKLRANGVDAEVINISYGGWGADQELEALTLEGLAYKPDLVILQFCHNDGGQHPLCGHVAYARDVDHFQGFPPEVR